MKRVVSLKTIACALAVFTSLGATFLSDITVSELNQTVSKKTTQAQRQVRRENFSVSEADLINDAMLDINKELEGREGRPYRVSRVYKMHGQKPLSASTKVYYADYRKKPDVLAGKNYQIGNTSNPDRVVEIVYHKKNNHVSLIERDANFKRLSSKQVELRNIVSVS